MAGLDFDQGSLEIVGACRSQAQLVASLTDTSLKLVEDLLQLHPAAVMMEVWGQTAVTMTSWTAAFWVNGELPRSGRERVTGIEGSVYRVDFPRHGPRLLQAAQ